MPKSRCDLCGKRIGPSRYDVGLCRACESLTRVVDSFAMIYLMIDLLCDRDFLRRIERESRAFSDIIKLAQGDFPEE